MMRVVITLILWAVIFCVGGLTSDRYGVPEQVTGMTDGAFEFVEEQLGGLLGGDSDG